MKKNNIQGAKILVIGGAGLIGSHVVDALVQEDVAEICVYDNFTRGSHDNLSTALRDPRVKIFELGGDILLRDILDQAVTGKDYVFHLAALWLLHCHEYPDSAFEVNVRGTFNVMQSCVKHGIRKLIYSSSASVYGDAVEEPMTEDHPYNNWTFYGATKIACEHMLKSYYQRYGLKSNSLRYMNVYGPRQDYQGAYIAVMMKILDCIDRGEPPVVYGDGSQSYDFIAVKDIARANICALKSAHPFGFYNVGRGIKTSIKELAELLLDISGSDQQVEYKPAGTTFVQNRVGDPEAAERDLGFTWSIDLREGMEALVKWRNHHKEAVDERRRRAGL